MENVNSFAELTELCTYRRGESSGQSSWLIEGNYVIKISRETAPSSRRVHLARRNVTTFMMLTRFMAKWLGKVSYDKVLRPKWFVSHIRADNCITSRISLRPLKGRLINWSSISFKYNLIKTACSFYSFIKILILLRQLLKIFPRNN